MKGSHFKLISSMGLFILVKANIFEPTLRTKVSSSKALFQQITTELLKTEVPKEAAEWHLRLLNSADTVSKLLGNMEQGFNSPMLAMQSGQKYLTFAPTFYQSVVNLNNYLTKKGVTLAPGEKVEVFVNLPK
jgi:hypothetical protein